jgi:hypothetical protein
MGSPHVCSPLVLRARLWLCVLLPLARPQRPVTTPAVPALPEPRTPQRPRSNAPQPCAGLTHKPHGALGAHDPAAPPAPPPVPPAPRAPPPRRPRAVDPARHFGPHRAGDARGWLGRGPRRATGPPRGGPWRPCPCPAGKGDFWEPHGPVCPGNQAAVARSGRGVAGRAAGLGSRATARGFAVAPHPGVPWVVAAAEPLRACSASCRCALPLEQRPLAAVSAGRRARQAAASSADAASRRLERSPSWGWTALAPTRPLCLVVAGGSRPLALAPRGGHPVPQGWGPDGGARLLTAGRTDSGPAVLSPVGSWRPPARRQDTGPSPQPRWRPRPGRLSAQGVQSSRRRRRVGVQPQVVCGPRWALEAVVARGGWTSQTALVERLTLDSRQRVAALGRRVQTLCQGAAGVREQCARLHV